MADTDITRALAKAREAGNLAYGYFVALVNHGGETEAAAKKGRDHLQVALAALASVPAGLCHTSTVGNADAETRHNVAGAARQAEALTEIRAEVVRALARSDRRRYGGRVIQEPLPRAVGKWVVRRINRALAAAAGDTSEEPKT